MPLYDIRCEETGSVSERAIKLADFALPIFCACGARAFRVMSVSRIIVDNTGYNCPVTDKWVGSKREHRENLQRQGCRVLETGEAEYNSKQREASEVAFDKKIEETVEREIESYSSDKKEQLHNELVNQKLDVSVERK